MAWLHVYVGRLDDPKFSWDGGDSSGNIPARIGPFFPYFKFEDFADTPYRRLRDAIEAGTYEGKQTDWSGWVAKVTKRQIEAFIADRYPDPDALLSGARRDYDELQQAVAQLEDGPLYALVAAEFPSEADAEM